MRTRRPEPADVEIASKSENPAKAARTAKRVRGWLLRRLPPGSLRQRFAAGAFWSVFGAVARRGALLLAAIACGRLLGTSQFGQLSIIQATAGVFGTFAGMGFGLTATKYAGELRRRDPCRAGRVLGLSAASSWIAGAAMALALVAMAPSLSKGLLASPALARPLALGSGLIFFGAVNGAQIGALVGIEAFKPLAAVSILTALISLPLTIGGVLIAGLQGAVLGLVLSLLVTCGAFGIVLRRECAASGIRYGFAGCWGERKLLWSFSAPTFVGSAITTPAAWACAVYLAREPGGYAQLGAFAAAQKYVGAALFLPFTATWAAMPILSDLSSGPDADRTRRFFVRSFAANGTVAAAAAVAIALAASPLMGLYGAGFGPGTAALLLLCASIPGQFAVVALGTTAISVGAVWLRCGVDCLAGALLVASAWALVPRFGAAGLAAAYALAFSLAAAGLAAPLWPRLKQ